MKVHFLYLLSFALLFCTSVSSLELMKDPALATEIGLDQAKNELAQEETLEDLKVKSQKVETLSIEKEGGAVFPPLDNLVRKMPALVAEYDWENLEIFGQEAFSKLSLELSRIPLYQKQVPPDYVLGAGDRLMVHFWNQTQDENLPALVNPSGTIRFPIAGEIGVQGIKQSELGDFLKKKLSKFYKDVNLTFQLTEVRKVPLFVTGESRVPGAFVGTALSTPLQLIFANGGITEKGSLRNLRLIRRGKLIQELDLYEFFLKGSLSFQRFLEPEDVLHIPVAKRRVAILGRVKRPAVYELKEGEGFKEVMDYAGGFEADADQSTIQLVRFDRLGRPSILDVDHKYSDNQELQDGSILLVPANFSTLKNSVKVEGNVFRPGVYQWKKGLTLKSLLVKAQGVKPGTYYSRAEIRRELKRPAAFRLNDGVNTYSQTKVLTIDLSVEMNSKKGKFKLQPQDQVKIISVAEAQVAPRIEVIGRVQKPGFLTLMDGMRVGDALFEAQLDDSAHMLRGEIHRKVTTGVLIVDFHPQKALQGKVEDSPLLQNGDLITIFENPQKRQFGRVVLKGQVKFPGTYPFKTGDTLSDILERAGGLIESSYLPASRFYRASVARRQEEIKDEFVRREKEQLEQYKLQALSKGRDTQEREKSLSSLEEVSGTIDLLEKAQVSGRIRLELNGVTKLSQLVGTVADIPLEDGDLFEVPLKPNEVTILGQVYNPTTVLFQEEMRFDDYISLAGGLSENAYKDRIYVIHADGAAVPVKHLNKRRRGFQVNQVRAGDSRNLNFVLKYGDTVVVPSRIRLGENRLQTTLDSVYKIAVSVGALGGLFN